MTETSPEYRQNIAFMGPAGPGAVRNFFEKKDFLSKVVIFTKKLYFHQKILRDKADSIGNGLTSSGTVYLYRPCKG